MAGGYSKPGKRSVSKKKKSEPKKTSGYMVFGKELREQAKEKGIKIDFKHIGDEWKAMDFEEQEKYNEKADDENEANGFDVSMDKEKRIVKHKETKSKKKNEKHEEEDDEDEEETQASKKKKKGGKKESKEEKKKPKKDKPKESVKSGKGKKDEKENKKKNVDSEDEDDEEDDE
jgi:hypothetical protein